MADFGTAIQWLKEGKKVHRPMSDSTTYNYLDITEETIYQTNAWGGKSRVTTWPTQAVMATDWEIREEPSLWNKGDTAFVKVEILQTHMMLSSSEHFVIARIHDSGSICISESDLLTAAEIRGKP